MTKKNESQEVLDQVLEKLTANNEVLIKDIEHKLQEQRTNLEEIIHKHPLTSVAVAFGAGYIIAKIFSTRGYRK